MNDETGTNNAATGSERVGFCQDCGRPLTQETVRQVGAGVFCEPCLNARVGAPAPPPVGATAPIPPMTSAPSPAIAAMLGMIPGVGAMYNGQYAKGLAHFVIFAVLMSLGDNHSIFGLLGFGWWVYQIFDAYHTAKARIEGLPLPNPFGLNDIGDRMGFGKNWPGSAARPVSQTPPAAWAPGAAAPPAAAKTTDWVGYVPPTQFATSPPPVTAAPAADPATPAPNWGSIPYAPPVGSPYTAPYARTYTGTEGYTPVAPVLAPEPRRRFPAGALWLIGLGLLFTLANIDSSFRISERWIMPILLAGLGSWILTRRLTNLHGDYAPVRVVHILRVPVLLLVLAVLWVLYAANVFTLAQTWPVMLLVLGGLLLLERTFEFSTPYVAPVAPPAPTAVDDATKGGA